MEKFSLILVISLLIFSCGDDKKEDIELVACKPDSCKEYHRNVCKVVANKITCECDKNYKLKDGVCVKEKQSKKSCENGRTECSENILKTCITDKWVEVDCSADNKVCQTKNDISSCEEKKRKDCKDVICSESTVCNPKTGECIAKCKPYECEEGNFCNTETFLCETTSYPKAPYGKVNGSVIKNLKWIDANKRNISLGQFHSRYKTTGYPRVILLIQSVGWAKPCRYGVADLGEFFAELKVDGNERISIIQVLSAGNEFNEFTDKASADIFAKSWIQQYDLTYPVIGELKTDKTISDYNATGAVPFNMFIDPETMKIEYVNAGAIDLNNLKNYFAEKEKKVLCGKINCPLDKCNYNMEEEIATCK